MLSNYIDDWSARTGLSRVDLARIVGVTYGCVNQWAQGVCIPRPRRMRALATALGVDPVELMRDLKAARAKVETR